MKATTFVQLVSSYCVWLTLASYYGCTTVVQHLAIHGNNNIKGMTLLRIILYLVFLNYKCILLTTLIAFHFKHFSLKLVYMCVNMICMNVWVFVEHSLRISEGAVNMAVIDI